MPSSAHRIEHDLLGDLEPAEHGVLDHDVRVGPLHDLAVDHVAVEKLDACGSSLRRTCGKRQQHEQEYATRAHGCTVCPAQ